MKKMILFFAVTAATLISCQKEAIEPAPENNNTQAAAQQLNFFVVDDGFTYTDVYVKVDGTVIGSPEVEMLSTIVSGNYVDNPANVPVSTLTFSVNDGQTYLIEFFDAANDQLIGFINEEIISNEPDGYFFGATDPAFQLTTYGNTLLPNSFQEIRLVDGPDNQLFYFLELQM